MKQRGKFREKPGLPRPSAARIGTLALGWIAADEERVSRFLTMTGVAPDGVAAAARDPAFLAAVLDHILAHEPDARDCAAALGLTAAALHEAAIHLGGPKVWDST